MIITYLFLEQVRVAMETSTVMEKRKASAESAEADKQYLGKFIRHFVTVILIFMCIYSTTQ